MWTRSELKLIEIEGAANLMATVGGVAQLSQLWLQFATLKLRLEHVGVGWTDLPKALPLMIEHERRAVGPHQRASQLAKLLGMRDELAVAETDDWRPRYQDKWTNDDQLWWTGAKQADQLQIAVPVESDGRYDVSVILTKAVDYGIVQLSIDDTKMGKPIDLFNRGVIRTDAIPLGTMQLTRGEHVLGVEIVGKNENAVPSYMFGLDEVVLEKAK